MSCYPHVHVSAVCGGVNFHIFQERQSPSPKAMSYVTGTSMTRDFKGLEQLKRSERDQVIRDLEKSYAYWWRREEDGTRGARKPVAPLAAAASTIPPPV
jgi:hypothetical protein